MKGMSSRRKIIWRVRSAKSSLSKIHIKGFLPNECLLKTDIELDKLLKLLDAGIVILPTRKD
jgi:hypothetical protein